MNKLTVLIALFIFSQAVISQDDLNERFKYPLEMERAPGVLGDTSFGE
jgi:hypothetical protein